MDALFNEASIFIYAYLQVSLGPYQPKKLLGFNPFFFRRIDKHLPGNLLGLAIVQDHPLK
jgi:hypothetical protein